MSFYQHHLRADDFRVSWVPFMAFVAALGAVASLLSSINLDLSMALLPLSLIWLFAIPLSIVLARQFKVTRERAFAFLSVAAIWLTLVAASTMTPAVLFFAAVSHVAGLATIIPQSPAG